MVYKNVEIQEKMLQFEHFSNEDAINLGNIIYQLALEQGVRVSIDISRNGLTLFHLLMPGTGADNEGWMRRKRNTTCHYQTSSVLFEKSEREGSLVSSGLNPMDYVAAGGAFPVNLRGTGCIGAVVISGLKGIQDHNLAAQGIAKLLGVEGCPNAEFA